MINADCSDTCTMDALMNVDGDYYTIDAEEAVYYYLFYSGLR